MIELNPNDPLPPVHQVVQQLARAIIMGHLKCGDRIPTVRQLASDLGLANGTVARAYQMLEQNGYLETRGRKGTFVKASAATIPAEEAERQIQSLAQQLALTAALVGARREEVLTMVSAALERTLSS